MLGSTGMTMVGPTGSGISGITDDVTFFKWKVGAEKIRVHIVGIGICLLNKKFLFQF